MTEQLCLITLIPISYSGSQYTAKKRLEPLVRVSSHLLKLPDSRWSSALWRQRPPDTAGNLEQSLQIRSLRWKKYSVTTGGNALVSPNAARKNLWCDLCLLGWFPWQQCGDTWWGTGVIFSGAERGEKMSWLRTEQTGPGEEVREAHAWRQQAVAESSNNPNVQLKPHAAEHCRQMDKVLWRTQNIQIKWFVG